MCIRDSDKDLKVYRCNNYDTVSYHTSKNNEDGISICLIGNYEVEIPSIKIVDLLIKTYGEIQDHLGPLELKYHSQFKATKCPGKNLIDALKQRGVSINRIEKKSWYKDLFRSKKGCDCG